VRYTIIFSPGAEDDLSRLRAHDRANVLDAIEKHLRYEPETTSKSRIKRLQALEHPQYRLRVDDIRVFYDVFYEISDGFVEVIAIKQKEESILWLLNNGE
jgi:mRNA-degrading endonuclease RelE of RelBE toxin-antitoxin system